LSRSLPVNPSDYSCSVHPKWPVLVGKKAEKKKRDDVGPVTGKSQGRDIRRCKQM